MAEKEKTAEKGIEQRDAKGNEKTIDESTQKILEMSEISLWLDNYDDIFSDFDPRPYSQRSLSDDFLNETKKASIEKAGRLELRFLVAEDKRNPKDEATIKKRLHEHFNKHAHLLHREIKNTRNKSLLAAFLGVLMMLSATYINSFADTFITRFLFVLLEPAGWFTVWFSLDKLFYATELKKREYSFYQKMSKCEIIFSPY